MSARDVFIIGWFGRGNLGNDFLARFILEQVCSVVSPDRVVIWGLPGNYMEKWFPGIESRDLADLFTGTSDIKKKVVFGGGGQFFAFPPANESNGQGLLVSTMAPYVNILEAAGWANTRIYAFCVGVGPVVGEGALACGRYLFSKFEQLSVRDFVSQNIAGRLGRLDARLAADPFMTAFAAPKRPAWKAQPKHAGIVIRSWKWEPDIEKLYDSLLSAARALRREGWAVEFISFEPADDRPVIDSLKAQGELVRAWQADAESAEGFYDHLSQFKALVTMRGHGILLSARLGIIPIGIDIDPKLGVLAEQCGCAGYMIRAMASVDELVGIIKKAESDRLPAVVWQLLNQAVLEETGRLKEWLKS